MRTPWKHPRTGVYWFRRGVPKDCQAILGKREWNRTLETKSLREAERAILPCLVETNQTIQDVRDGTYRRYSDEKLEAIAIAWSGDLDITIEAAQELRREGFQGKPISEDDREFPISNEPDLDRSIQRVLGQLD